MYEKNYNLKKRKIRERIKIIINKKGLWYLLKKGFYIYLFPIYIFLFAKKRKLIFNNSEIEYFFHKHNHTWANERAIEIPLILSLIKGMPDGDVIEIGNVLSNYIPTEWDVLDKYEKSSRVINEDVLSYIPSKKYKRVISISTLEHIGFDEKPKDNKKILRTISYLKKNYLCKNGEIIFTVPVGWNPDLDKILQMNEIYLDEVYYFKRIRWDNKWKISDRDETLDTKFAKPYIGANGLVLGVIKNRIR